MRIRSLILSALLALPAAAQGAESIPRTKDGHPDFQGIWTSRWTTPLERPAGSTTLVVSKAEGEALHRSFLARLDAANPLSARDARDLTGPLVIDGETRSSVIVDPADGRMPFTEEGRLRRSQIPTNASGGFDGPEQRGLTERCIISGAGHAPFLAMPANNIRQFVQTHDYLIIFTESYYQLRIIPLNGLPGLPLARGGWSSGRWNKDTLVVETGGFSLEDHFRSASGGTAFPITPLTRMTEQFTRTGPDEILYRFRIEDPALYTQPWSGESLLKRSNERMFEFACHEGDYSLYNILLAARITDARAGIASKH